MDGDEGENHSATWAWPKISTRIVSHSLMAFQARWLSQMNPEMKPEHGNKSANSGSVSPPGIKSPKKRRCVYGGTGSFTPEHREVDMAALRLSFPGDCVAPEADKDETLDMETVFKAAFQGLKICVDYLLGQLRKLSRGS